MKTGMLLVGALIVACTVAFVRGREAATVSANGGQESGCAVLAADVPARARPVGAEQIPSPAASFIEIGDWARDRWHRLWGQPLDRKDCVWAADSAD